MNFVRPVIAAPVPAPAIIGVPSPEWRRHLVALAVVSAGLMLCFRRDLFDMVGQWWHSSTYGHCLFIPPIIVWLVRQRLPALRQLQPAAWWPGLVLVAAGAAGWLLGDAAGVSLARQYGLVMMLQGGVVACLGPAVARGVLFPLCYALLLVPAGEELVPPLQTLTAAMCMRLLDLAGVPAHIDGVFITIPNGYFEVAEACSGVKFLVAMVAYATLVAHVCFRSPKRRAVFLVAALALPVVANGLRAFGTIYVAHLTDSDFASGFDHVVYGWVFFGTVMIALMAAACPFFDRGVDTAWIDSARLQPATPPVQPPRRVTLTAAVVLAVAGMPLVWSAIVDARGGAATPQRAVLPEVAGWTQSPRSAGPEWQPHFAGADQLLLGHYRDRAGRSADLAVAVFDRQQEGRELVGYGQGAVAPDGPWAWTAQSVPPAGGRAFRILGPGPVVREVAIFYRLGDVTTGSDLRVKIETLKARLLGRSQRAVAVLVSAPQVGDADARFAVDDFLRALGPIDRVAGVDGR
jgi:exosortase A